MTLSPTQRRFYELLADGVPHVKDEFYPLLWDEQNENKDTAVRMQLVRLRRKLGTYGLSIETRGKNGVTTYRLIRPVTSGE